MVRSYARRNWGIGLAEALTAVVVVGIVSGTVAAIYSASMQTYSRGITENYAHQKASWAVQRMAPDIRQGISVTPGDAPFDSCYVAIRLPNRPFDSGEGAHLNEVTLDATGAPYLVPGGWVVYYRGAEDGTLTAAGDRIWRRLLAADGATLVREDVIADHVIDNPLDESGTPAPMFIYWPDIFRLRSVEITVTVEEQRGPRKAQATMTGEFTLRNR